MQNKYRVFVKTRRGGFFAASSDSVNGLSGLVSKWLESSSPGRAVYDDQVQAVMLYEYDPKTGAFHRVETLPANSRRDIIRKVRQLGAR